MPLIGIDPTGIQPRQQCWEMVRHRLGDDGYLRNELCILKFLTHLTALELMPVAAFQRRCQRLKILVMHYSLPRKSHSASEKLRWQS